MLKTLGHTCLTCQDPQEAKSIISENARDLDAIITDYSMPEVSGLDILEYSQRVVPDVPVFLTSGYADSDTREVAVRLGAADVLTKPMNMARLSEALSMAGSSRIAA